MIKRTLIYFLVFFALYNAALYVWKPGITTAQSQNQGNIIGAENYIYNGQGKDIVMVGTSLTFRIKQDYLPDNYYNLAFGGYSIYDGLEIIKRSGNIPKIVLIESNTIIRPGNVGFINSLFTPGLSWIKKMLPGMWTPNQPENLLMNELQHLTAKNKPVAATTTAPPDTALHNKALKGYQNEYNRVPGLDTVDMRIEALKTYTEYLKGLGVQVIFFEMPVDCSLENSPRLRYLRKKLGFEFPPAAYPRIPMPDCSKYIYNDGEHFSAPSAIDYSHYLVREVDSVLSLH